jgi:hypothetical protein
LAALCGCGHEIVLGDTESALPAPSASAGSSSSAGATGSGGTSGTDGSAGTEADAGKTTSAGAAGATALPAPGELVWSSDFEDGNYSDWERGGVTSGGKFEWGDVSIDVEPGVGRDDSHGLSVLIDTSFRGDDSQGGRLYRRLQSGPAYYSAWFEIEEAHAVSDWWALSVFHARDDSLSLENTVDLWDARVVDLPNGELSLQLFDHDTEQGMTLAPAGLVQPGRWFELTLYLHYRPPSDTRLAMFLDGKLLIDVKGVHSSVEDHVFWTVGNGAALLDPPECTVYVDDASIRVAAP